VRLRKHRVVCGLRIADLRKSWQRAEIRGQKSGARLISDLRFLISVIDYLCGSYAFNGLNDFNDFNDLPFTDYRLSYGAISQHRSSGGLNS
jgi:hypothetical protein